MLAFQKYAASTHLSTDKKSKPVRVHEIENCEETKSAVRISNKETQLDINQNIGTSETLVPKIEVDDIIQRDAETGADFVTTTSSLALKAEIHDSKHDNSNHRPTEQDLEASAASSIPVVKLEGDNTNGSTENEFDVVTTTSMPVLQSPVGKTSRNAETDVDVAVRDGKPIPKVEIDEVNSSKF